MKKMRARFCGLCAVLACGSLQAGQTDLKGITTIYFSPDGPKSEQTAAGHLARFLGRAIEKDVAVNPADRPYDAAAPHAVFLGRKMALESGILKPSDLEPLKWDGFAIGFRDGRVAIAGNRNTSVNNGVVELLHRIGYMFFEYNWYNLDSNPQLSFDNGVLSRNPAFEYRAGGWTWFYRTNTGLRAGGEFSDATHTANHLIPKHIYREEHPEYYAMNLDGERELYTWDNDLYVHLCMSNPDVQRIAIERALDWVRENPDAVYFAISHGDGHDWCQCGECKAHDVVTGNYSDRMLELMVNPVARAVAEVRPDAKIVMLAYCGTDEPPVKEKPESNVYVMYCPYFGIALSMAHPFTHPLNAEALRQFQGWQKLAPERMMIYDYNMGFVPSWDAWAEKVKWFHEQGLRTGAVMCGIPSTFRWMFSHINEQLQWDPSLDYRDIQKKYIETAYGPAAPHLMRYFDIVRERLDKGYAIGIHGRSWTGYFGDGAISRMVDAFRQALAAVEDDGRRTRDLRGEFNQLVDVYLNEAVSAAILSGEETPPPPEAREGKPGNLDWRITDKDRATASDLVQWRIRKDLDTLAAQAIVLVEDEREGVRKRAEGAIKSAQRRLRRIMERFGPMTIPEDADIAALAEAYLDDPGATVKQHPFQKPEPVTAEILPNGVVIPAGAFRDGFGPLFYYWYCRPGRDAMIVYVPHSPRPSVMRANFTLKKAPDKGAILDIAGQDGQNDMLPPAQIRISINGNIVHEGDCGFVKRGWSRREFAVPPGVLKAGENELEVRNIHEDTSRLDGWWFALSEAKFVLK